MSACSCGNEPVRGMLCNDDPRLPGPIVTAARTDLLIDSRSPAAPRRCNPLFAPETPPPEVLCG